MDFLAGCIGGVAGVLVGHPFDTVKVRLQVQNVDKPLYRGTFHCFQSIIRQESMLGLYKGLSSPMMGLTFINAIVFGVQGHTLRLLGRDTPTNQFLAGTAAGMVQCVVCCPMELVKTRMQMQGAGQRKVQTKLYKNSLDCLMCIYRREGLRGINRGMMITVVRETPGFGIYFLTYDLLTRWMGCAPNVVKSRLQADGVGGVNRYSSVTDCVRQCWQKEGWRGFTRGLNSTLLRAFPVNAATFATVTLFLMYMQEDEGKKDCDLAPGVLHPQAEPSGL
uniref:Mitochondrial basic amino acids transporter n=1 Tax=Scleropages formosus TaxID=113540 RepID=A0A8C9QRI5_SCLFO